MKGQVNCDFSSYKFIYINLENKILNLKNESEFLFDQDRA